jgi:histidine phosphotransferase ChpT
VNDRLRLAELLAIRLCHDISSPLGTLMGSLAMVNDDPEGAAEALELATEVSDGLARRLRLLRAAWGGAADIGVAEMTTLLEGLPQARKVAVDLSSLPAGGRFAAGMARAVLNVLLLAGESLPGGGAIVVSGDPAEVVVRLAGPRAAWPAGFAAWMADDAQAWAAFDSGPTEAPRRMQGPLTALIARAGGVRLGFLMAAATEQAPPLVISARG